MIWSAGFARYLDGLISGEVDIDFDTMKICSAGSIDDSADGLET